MQYRLLQFFLWLLFIQPLSSFSVQAQTLDPDFSPMFKNPGQITVMALQPDGKVVVAGDFTYAGEENRSRIARFNADGSIDEGFNAEGSGSNNRIRAIALQEDGKIIIGGDFTSYNGTAINRIARLNANGTLDTEFAVGSGAMGAGGVYDLAIQTDGKIIAVGLLTNYQGVTNRIVRILPNGTRDTSFNIGEGANGLIHSVAMLGNNIVIGGDFTSFNNTTANRIALLGPTGAIVDDFGGANGNVHDIRVLADNSLLIGGAFTEFGGVAKNRLVKVTPQRIVDTTFNPANAATPNQVPGASGGFSNVNVQSIAVQEGGKIFIGGAFAQYNGVNRSGFAKLNADGTLDTEYNSGFGVTGSTGVNSIILQDGLHPLIGGGYTAFSGRTTGLIALDGNTGAFREDFTGSVENDGEVKTVAFQNGKILVGGIFRSVNGEPRSNLARLNQDGTLDTSFDMGSGFNNTVNTIAVQADGAIIIGGDFTNYNGSAVPRLARLWPNGSLHTEFISALGTGPNLPVIKVAATEAGILVGGYFTQFGTINTGSITRLRYDGSLDNTFNTAQAGAAGPQARIEAIQMQGNQILIGGNFETYNGAARTNLARLNSDGTLDESFAAGNPNATVFAVHMRPWDDKILIGGLFTQYNGTAANRLARLMPDGTLDPDFNAGTGPNNSVRSIFSQSDNKVIAGGEFTAFAGAATRGIARTQATGQRDNAFGLSNAMDGFVYAIAFQDSGQLLVGGNFSVIGGQKRGSLARLADETILSKPMPKAMDLQLDVYPNPARSTFRVSLDEPSLSTATVSLYSIQGSHLADYALSSENGILMQDIQVGHLSKGIYVLKLATRQGSVHRKVVIE
jgi:uncharacterized delta-60 repeat protein